MLVAALLSFLNVQGAETFPRITLMCNEKCKQGLTKIKNHFIILHYGSIEKFYKENTRIPQSYLNCIINGELCTLYYCSECGKVKFNLEGGACGTCCKKNPKLARTQTLKCFFCLNRPFSSAGGINNHTEICHQEQFATAYKKGFSLQINESDSVKVYDKKNGERIIIYHCMACDKYFPHTQHSRKGCQGIPFKRVAQPKDSSTIDFYPVNGKQESDDVTHSFQSDLETLCAAIEQESSLSFISAPEQCKTSPLKKMKVDFLNN